MGDVAYSTGSHRHMLRDRRRLRATQKRSRRLAKAALGLEDF
jgi:hypothetical protein